MGFALYNCEVEGREEHAGAPKAQKLARPMNPSRVWAPTGWFACLARWARKKSLRVSSRPAAPSEAGAMLSAHN